MGMHDARDDGPGCTMRGAMVRLECGARKGVCMMRGAGKCDTGRKRHDSCPTLRCRAHWHDAAPDSTAGDGSGHVTEGDWSAFYPRRATCGANKDKV